jgi:hypothetical protein
MAIVRAHGKPDFFITMTANPSWIEITNELNGESFLDRPDIVVRVFKQKFKELCNDLFHRHIFGHCLYYMWVIEFQKRGLPHCHILMSVRQEDKINNSVPRLDNLISAELPDPIRDPRLYQIVTRCMLHGPCTNRTQSACRQADPRICSKFYPKEYCNHTIINPNGRMTYRRLDNGNTYTKTVGHIPHVYDNRDVVPYNRYLLLKYNCHINVEHNSMEGPQGLVYLYNYIYKGHDAANVTIAINNNGVLDHDEIQHFINTRYVSAMEGIWRIFEFDMHDKSHTIYRLNFHLPDEQNVYFREGDEEQAAIRAAVRQTQFTAWFELNRIDANARRYLYSEIPLHYTYNKNTRIWTRRIRLGLVEKTIPRLNTISPRNIQLYMMRILLLHVPGDNFYYIKKIKKI